MSTLRERAEFLSSKICADLRIVRMHHIVVAAIVALCLLAGSAADADPVEYYRYTIDEQGDTTVFIVASYDTVAMQLWGEIQQSPLGSAVETSDLTDEGGGQLVGNLVVSVTGEGGQYISLTSTFQLSPTDGPSHTDSVDVDFDVLATTRKAPDGPSRRQGEVRVEGKLTTKENSQTGEKETTAEISLIALISDLAIRVAESVTKTAEGEYLGKSSLFEIKTEGGTTSICGKLRQSEDQQGRKATSASADFTYPGSNCWIRIGGGIEEASEGTTKNVGVETKIVANEAMVLGGMLDYISRPGIADSLSLDVFAHIKPTSDATIELRASHDALTKETTGFISACFEFADIVQNQQKGLLIATAESASDTFFCSTLQSRFCCPDSSACLDQPLLEDWVPVGDWPPVCMIHRSTWQPWDCDSFTESLSTELAGVPGDTPILSYSLFQNSPNPLTMGGKGVIQYGLPKPANVVLKVYDIHGREVTTLVDSEQPAGWHYVEVDPADFTSGIYFYRISMGGFVKQQKMTVLR